MNWRRCAHETHNNEILLIYNFFFICAHRAHGVENCWNNWRKKEKFLLIHIVKEVFWSRDEKRRKKNAMNRRMFFSRVPHHHHTSSMKFHTLICYYFHVDTLFESLSYFNMARHLPLSTPTKKKKGRIYSLFGTFFLFFFILFCIFIIIRRFIFTSNTYEKLLISHCVHLLFYFLIFSVFFLQSLFRGRSENFLSNSFALIEKWIHWVFFPFFEY